MNAFIIIPNNTKSKNGKLVSTLSAFVGINSIGIAEDVGEAIDVIKQRYPDISIFNSKILEEKNSDYLVPILEGRGSFIILPKYRQFGNRCTYIGIDFFSAAQKEWVLHEIGETLREYHRYNAL